MTAAPPRTLFISDLHLAGTRPAITRRFVRFLAEDARNAHVLYILGDLFDFWVGDDAAGNALDSEVIEALAQLSATGTLVRVMHGNRDFLLSSGFECAAGARLINDPVLIDLYGVPTLLMHGDTLCTDDQEYQNFRRRVRDPATQRAFLALPVEQRRAQVGQTRVHSERAKSEKSLAIMDVTPSAVESVLRQHGYPPRLIHGHTHRPATHRHEVDGRCSERWVLADWSDERGEYLEATPLGIRRVALAG